MNQTGDNFCFCCFHLWTSHAIFREIRQVTSRVLHHGLKENNRGIYTRPDERSPYIDLITEGVRDSSLHEFYFYFRANFFVEYGGKYKGPRN